MPDDLPLRYHGGQARESQEAAVGTYVNPGNDGFARIRRERYVDKTGLIALVNDVLDGPRNMVAVCRPRRFGKSFAAEALVAYYSCGCDSRSLFEGLDISRDPSFEEHLNAYNVIQLDMTAFTGTVGAEVVPAVTDALMDDLAREFADMEVREALTDRLLEAVRDTVPGTLSHGKRDTVPDTLSHS